MGAISTSPSPVTLARAIARGGHVAAYFANRASDTSAPSTRAGGCSKPLTVPSSRAGLRDKLVEEAKAVHTDFRKSWSTGRRPRVTPAFRTGCGRVRAPFTLNGSLPLASDTNQVALATFETTLRGVEEELMVTLCGALPNVTYARILAAVFERAEAEMPSFDPQQYRLWCHVPWNRAHSVGPGALGCPWSDGASRILPKGALGNAHTKPMHDDDNGAISLSCWTAMTESDSATELVFLIGGAQVVLKVKKLRWVLFMGFVPHESRWADPSKPGSAGRVHHSSFVKPEVGPRSPHTP